VVLAQNAAIKYAIHSDTRHLGSRIINIKDIPVADPEVKLSMLRCDAGMADSVAVARLRGLVRPLSTVRMTNAEKTQAPNLLAIGSI